MTNMAIQKPQHYTPLDTSELKEVQKALKGNPLMSRVISQLSQQERYLELQRAHHNIIHRDPVDVIRDIADEYEMMREKITELENNHND